MRIAALLSATAIALTVVPLATPALAQSPDLVAINGIIDQGFNHSEVMNTAMPGTASRNVANMAWPISRTLPPAAKV